MVRKEGKMTLVSIVSVNGEYLLYQKFSCLLFVDSLASMQKPESYTNYYTNPSLYEIP